jgi:hypothetical protein
MAKVVTRLVYSVVIAILICGMLRVVPVLAQGGGYEGLIAPVEPESKPAEQEPPPAASGGYEGLVAPPPSARNPANPKHEPPGYSGLIPGYVAEPPPSQPAQATPAPTNPNVTPKSAEDLKMLSTLQGIDKEGGALKLRGPEKVSKEDALVLNKPRPRIDKMLPAEYAMKATIDDLMPGILDKKIPSDLRTRRVKAAREELAELAAGFQQKKSVPDAVYREMGVGDTFIREEREGTNRALAMLGKALSKLKEYE